VYKKLRLYYRDCQRRKGGGASITLLAESDFLRLPAAIEALKKVLEAVLPRLKATHV
jgi:hypothetical protein